MSSNKEYEFAKFNTDYDNNHLVNEKFNRTNYSEFIKYICALTNVKSYLELGVSIGFCLHNVSKIVDKAVGVDLEDNRQFKGGEFHKIKTDDFFAVNTDKFDLIFIDANHDIEYVVKDFENSLKVLNPNGIIILDDTDPLYEYLTSQSRCGDAYKIKDHIRKNHYELDIVTLPILCKGMSIVTRNSISRFIQNK
jgi:predicted O-methyltransferase YrrM